MNLTVSSTSMMQPVLMSVPGNNISTTADHTSHPIKSATEADHPIRIVGMLELNQRNNLHDNSMATQYGTFYSRPHLSAASAMSLVQHDFKQISLGADEVRIAVFGYHYDHESIWYKLWNKTSRTSCWVLDNPSMTYTPFSLVAMEELRCLLPVWDGQIFEAPGTDPERATNNNGKGTTDTVNRRASDVKLPKRISSPQGNMLVSDALVQPNGRLWFLVTVQSNVLQSNLAAPTKVSTTGWVTRPRPNIH